MDKIDARSKELGYSSSHPYAEHPDKKIEKLWKRARKADHKWNDGLGKLIDLKNERDHMDVKERQLFKLGQQAMDTMEPLYAFALHRHDKKRQELFNTDKKYRELLKNEDVTPREVIEYEESKGAGFVDWEVLYKRGEITDKKLVDAKNELDRIREKMDRLKNS